MEKPNIGNIIELRIADLFLVPGIILYRNTISSIVTEVIFYDMPLVVFYHILLKYWKEI